ncbi:MAG: signal peptidase [Phycisphaerae bacterium]|jgi:cell fate regulator YaaT (PSP1 superfamily)
MAVRYGAMNWVGEFSYRQGSVFKCGGRVVLQTDRGIELGTQVSVSCTGCTKSVSREQIKRYVENSGPEFYKLRAGRILREATPQDLNEHERLNARLREDVDHCALLAAQLGMDMKVVTAEHLLGGERIVFYFRSDGRIDFRDLVRELARHHQTRIEMRQVGARDEARLVADYEVCGRECCCKNFLKKLRPVTMKMAKTQKSTLDPSKVSGRCGRLRCCLRYEHEGYEALAKKLPRIGSFVESTHGIGRVVDRQILTQLVLLRLADDREVALPIEDVQAFNVEPPPGMFVSRYSEPRDGFSSEREAPRGDGLGSGDTENDWGDAGDAPKGGQELPDSASRGGGDDEPVRSDAPPQYNPGGYEGGGTGRRRRRRIRGRDRGPDERPRPPDSNGME